MAVVAITPEGFALREIAEGLSVADVEAATGAPLFVPEAPSAHLLIRPISVMSDAKVISFV